MSFFLYARKSTDEPDRQILSIEAQLTELREFAVKEHLEIVREFVESQTAKEPGRPIFNDMISRIENGEASGILAWHPDRLARNSIDGGRIIYLIDTGKIVALKFPTFWFDPTPQGKFMLSIAFGQSKYYIDNLSENVKRGLRQKVRRGEQSVVAPTGYLNDVVNHKMIPDPERFRFVRKLFELYSTGNYSMRDLRDELTGAGFQSRTSKTFTVSNIQMMLKNPFYYGAFKFNGELYEGTHEPAITKKLFDQCQAVMQKKAHPRKMGGKHYAFQGFLRCGECGCGITYETKVKKSGREYVYYRCTKKKGACSQPYIREQPLAAELSEILTEVSLKPEWADFMLSKLEEDQAETAQSDALYVQNLKAQIKVCEEKLDTLLDAHLEKAITSEEYASKKNKLLASKIDLEQKLKDFGRKGNRWLELTRNLISSSRDAGIVASSASYDEIKTTVAKVGSNRLLRDKSVSLSFKTDWQILADFHTTPRSGVGQKEIYIGLLPGLDSDQNTGLQRPMSYH